MRVIFSIEVPDKTDDMVINDLYWAINDELERSVNGNYDVRQIDQEASIKAARRKAGLGLNDPAWADIIVRSYLNEDVGLF